MKDKIKIAGLFKDGWYLYVPTKHTTSFLEFLRDKISFSIDIAAMSGGLEPDIDIFVIWEGAKEELVKKLIEDFTKA